MKINDTNKYIEFYFLKKKHPFWCKNIVKIREIIGIVLLIWETIASHPYF